MRKLGIDQMMAWIISFLMSSMFFSGVFLALHYSGHPGFAAKSGVVHLNDEEQVKQQGHEDHHDSKPRHDDQHDSKQGHEDHHEPATDKHSQPANDQSLDQDKEGDHPAEGEGHSKNSDDGHHGKEQDSTEQHHVKTPQTNEEHQSAVGKFGKLWSYQGKNGPNYWGEMHDDYIACGVGKTQSPIDIAEPLHSRDLSPINFHYHPTLIAWQNAGYTLKGIPDSGSNYIEVDGKRYDLEYFELRSPSEHKVNGIAYDMEFQFVHSDTKGNSINIAVFLEEGKNNPVLAQLWQKMPTRPGQRSRINGFSPKDLLPRNKEYYFYSGSETMPPCREGVKWYVLSHPLDLSGKQIDKFIGVIKYNVRPVQQHYSRKALQSKRFSGAN